MKSPPCPPSMLMWDSKVGCWWLNTVAPVLLMEQQWKVRHSNSGRNALSSFNYVLRSLSCDLPEVEISCSECGGCFKAHLLIEIKTSIQHSCHCNTERCPFVNSLSALLCCMHGCLGGVCRKVLCERTKGKQNMSYLSWHETLKPQNTIGYQRALPAC